MTIDITPDTYEQWLDERGGQVTALRDLLREHELSSGEAARIVGVTGRSFRRYMDVRDGKPRYPVPYAVLFALLTRLSD